MLNRRQFAGSVAASGIAGPAIARSEPRPGPRASFRPGELWRDTAGKPIWVHGGSIITVGDTFYWYGENKERTTGRDRIWHWGVRAYRSRDLYNWEDAGLIIPPTPDDPASPLHPFKYMDRPHIMFHPETKKFVAWLKIMEDPWQTRAVLTADAITGPYTLLRKGQRPLGMSAGDFDLVASPDDHKGYMIFERVHSELIVADLTDDYTDFTKYYSTHFPRPGPPTVREGIAYFRRQGKHYLATSGTTGYFPNPTEVAISDTYHGPWTLLGGLHRHDATLTSFNSQISSIFRHPAKQDLYIAIADRWFGNSLSGPDFESGRLSRLVQSAFGKTFARPKQPLTPEEDKAMAIAGPLNVDTSKAGHVWLPIRFEGERPYIVWRDEWTLTEFT
jgi:hypothetical protein